MYNNDATEVSSLIRRNLVSIGRNESFASDVNVRPKSRNFQIMNY